jgi:hypothetical protein
MIVLGAALGVAVACGRIGAPPGPIAPMNACPDHACSTYAHAGASPVCADGVCVVAAQTSGFVLIVSLPEDSFFAPGRTFAVPFKNLSDGASPTCLLPSCARLPPVGFVEGSYIMTPDVWQRLVRWNLGNPLGTATALPVHATYRPLWGASRDDAASVGLPLDPVRAEQFVAFDGTNIGPAGGPYIAFQTYLAPGPYLRTLVPDPPFDRAFAPEIQAVTVPGGTRTFEVDKVVAFEVTTATTDPTTTAKALPTFDISRDAGLDGWKAYLRDATTKQVVSTVVPLSGIKTTQVVLATNRVPPKPDALCNAELVLAPPPGAMAPTGVFRAIGPTFPTGQTYPPLPAWANVHGTISTYDGAPVEADLVFEATGITVFSPPAPDADAGSDSGSGADAGQGKLNTNNTNFEYVGRASARLDPKTGTAGYSVDLPPGQYTLAVRPLNNAAALTVTSFAVGAQAGRGHSGPILRRLFPVVHAKGGAGNHSLRRVVRQSRARPRTLRSPSAPRRRHAAAVGRRSVIPPRRARGARGAAARRGWEDRGTSACLRRLDAS